MKIKLIAAAVASIVAAWAPSASAREAVALPGVVGAEGVLNGVDTTGNATLTIGNNQNINTNNDAGGAFTTNANLLGSLLFLGNSTVTGATGAIGSRYLNISAGAVGSTVNFNSAVFSSTFNLSGTGTVNFNGNVTSALNFDADGFVNLGAGRTLTGAITTNTASTGTLTLNGGSSVTGAIGGANGLKQINVAGGNAAITGAVQTLGLDLGTNTLSITGALTTNAGGTIATTIASDAVFGKVLAGTSLINAGGITVMPTVTGALTNGTSFRIVDAPAGTIGAPVSVINTNPRYTFSGLPTTTGDVNIVLSGIAPLALLVTAPGALAVAPVLDVNAAAGSDLLAIQNAIAVLPNAPVINNALAQLAPGTTNIAAPWVVGQATRLFEDQLLARLDEVQNVCCDTCEPNKAQEPVMAHECKGREQHGSWWGKGFASVGRQSDEQGVNGYRNEAQGLVLAYDKSVSDQTRLGAAAGYTNSTIDGNHASGRTEVDSYQLTAYVSHVPGPWFVQGALTVGTDNYEGARSIAFPGINRTASADYTGHQYRALVAGGKHFYVGAMTVTPLASLQASRIRVGAYSETGADTANLRVNSQSYGLVQSSLGVKAEQVIVSGSGTYSPEVHVKWLHDFKTTTMRQTATFSGGGNAFTAQGTNQDADLFNVGAGISFLACNCGGNTKTVKGLYDHEWNQSGYSSHKLSVVASMKF